MNGTMFFEEKSKLKLYGALVTLRFKFSVFCLLCVFIGLKNDPLFAIFSDSSDSSSSQQHYQKILKRHPNCFPEQHSKGYSQFIQSSEKNIQMYEELYGKRLAPLIFFADGMIEMGENILSGKDMDLQFFLPESWNYSARGRNGIITTNDAMYRLSPEIFKFLAQVYFFLPAQEFLKTALTYKLSKSDQSVIFQRRASSSSLTKGTGIAKYLPVYNEQHFYN